MSQYAIKDNKSLETIDFDAIEEKLTGVTYNGAVSSSLVGTTKQLYDNKNKTNPIYPKTLAKSVYLEDGTTIESAIAKIPIIVRANFKANGWNYAIDNTTLNTYNKKWKLRLVGAISCNSSSVLSTIRAKATNKILYYNDSALGASDIGQGDNYSVEQSTWLYFAKDTSMSCTFGSDDEGCAFLNDTYLGTWASCSSAAYTCNFKKGWNLLTICWHEGGGGAYGYCTTKFNTLVGNGTVLYQCAEPPFSLYQEVTISLGETKAGDNLMYLSASNATMANYLSERGTLIVGNNKIKYTLPIGVHPTLGANKFNNVDCDILFIK